MTPSDTPASAAKEEGLAAFEAGIAYAASEMDGLSDEGSAHGQMEARAHETYGAARDWLKGLDSAEVRSAYLHAQPHPSQQAGTEGEFDALEEHEHDDQRELSLLYRHRFDDSLQFNRGQMRMAIRHGRRLAALTSEAKG